MKIVGFADDLYIIGDNEMITTRLLANEVKIIGLQINNDKLQNDEDPGDTEQLLYEKVEHFKYLGRTLNTKND